MPLFLPVDGQLHQFFSGNLSAHNSLTLACGRGGGVVEGEDQQRSEGVQLNKKVKANEASLRLTARTHNTDVEARRGPESQRLDI